MVATVLVSCGGGNSMKMGDNQYPVRAVGTSNADMKVTYPATIKGIQDVEIRPKVSGFITKVCVHEGQSVGAGQLLFVIDNETYQSAVRQAQAAVNTSRAQLNTAKLTYDNNKKLFDKNIIGQYELSTALNSYETAKATLAQAQASLASAKEMLSFCYVKSPTSGVVGSLPFKEGALVSASSVEPLTTVSNISTMEVYFSMTEKDIMNLTKKSGGIAAAIADYPQVKLQLADGTIYNHPGKVVKASGVIDAATGSVSMIARFANPEKLLKSGGSGQIVVPTNDANAIMIPQDATSEVQDKVFVYLVGKDNKVKYTEIKINPQNDGKTYIVTSGLSVGDRIVTKGITKLADGMEIKPITEEQYQKNLEKAIKMGEANGSSSKFIDAMK
ncbi:MAG TPA: efflux RND transporter periplasmic adaptor subunit [Prevotella sp.]